ncbi:glutathione S-transferase protein [Cooperia oncophora]
MVNYKLTYFDGDLFALADQKYEDVRLTREAFAPLKETFPFGQMPVLEVDGKQLAQSLAINRYLARTFGFAGKDDFEAATIDSLADQYSDYRGEMKSYYYAAHGFMPGDPEKLKTEVLMPARDKFLKFVTNFLKKNAAHGYLVGDKISWVDVLIAEHMADMCRMVPGFLDGFPEVSVGSFNLIFETLGVENHSWWINCTMVNYDFES